MEFLVGTGSIIPNTAAFYVGSLLVAPVPVTITREVQIDLESDGRVIAFGNQDSWEGIVSIEDTTIKTGVTLIVKIRFKNSKALELSNPGTNPLNSGLELTKLSFFPVQPPGTEYRASGTYTYVGVDGELLSNPTPWDISSGGVFAG